MDAAGEKGTGLKTHHYKRKKKKEGGLPFGFAQGKKSCPYTARVKPKKARGHPSATLGASFSGCCPESSISCAYEGARLDLPFRMTNRSVETTMGR